MCVGNSGGGGGGGGARALTTLYKLYPPGSPTLFVEALIYVQCSKWMLIHQTASLTEMKTPS